MMANNSVDKRISRTEAAFKKALVELLQTKEFSAISVSDLVEKSGYSRSAFYQRFETKDEFLKKLVYDEVRHYMDVSLEAIQNGRVTERSILGLFSHVYNNKEFYSLVFGKNNANPLLTEDYFILVAHKIFMSTGNLRTHNEEVDLDMYNYTSMRKYLSYIRYWVMTGFKYSPEYIAKQYGFIEKFYNYIYLEF